MTIHNRPKFKDYCQQLNNAPRLSIINQCSMTLHLDNHWIVSLAQPVYWLSCHPELCSEWSPSPQLCYIQIILASIDLSFSEQLEDLGGRRVLDIPCVCLSGVAALHFRWPGLILASGQCLYNITLRSRCAGPLCFVWFFGSLHLAHGLEKAFYCSTVPAFHSFELGSSFILTWWSGRSGGSPLVHSSSF